MRVALMVTCINDAMYPETGRATVTLVHGPRNLHVLVVG